MIKIEFPKPNTVIRQREQVIKPGEVVIAPYYGFIDFHEITREKGGIFMFYNEQNQLLFVGKARKVRQRIKRYFDGNIAPLNAYKHEVHKIEVYEIEDPMEREIYETYAINTFRAKYNVDKAFFRDAEM